MAENRKNYKKTWAAWLLTFLVSLSSVSCAVLAGPEYKADPQHPAEFRLADGAGLPGCSLTIGSSSYMTGLTRRFEIMRIRFQRAWRTTATTPS